MRVKNSKRLGEIAVEKEWLSVDQRDECLSAQQQIADLGCHKRIGEIFVERGLLSSDQRDQLLRAQRAEHQQRYFGDYQLHEKLGQGGMGTVYRATRKNGEEVALKVMSRELSARPQFVDRFEREAAVAASLSHPNLVHTFGAELLDNRRVLVMEYVAGTQLAKRIKSDDGLPEGLALAIVRQLADALGAIHERGIVHRDVKPGNVLIDSKGDAKLLDLGLAKKVGASEHSITMTGQLIGTPDFMAPEQFLGKDMDHRVDIYALGATLYSMVTGRAPFEGRENAQAIMMGHLSGSFLDPMELVPDLGDGTAHVIEKAMAVEPGDRYQSMCELAADLERVAGGLEPVTQRMTEAQTMVMRKIPRGRRRRRVPPRTRGPRGSRSQPNWTPVAIGAGAIMLVLLIAAFGSGPSDEPSEDAPVARHNQPALSPGSIGSGSVADAEPEKLRFRDPAWYFSIELPGNWSKRKAKGRMRLRADGPRGETLTVEVDDVGEDVTIPLVELARSERVMRASQINIPIDDIPSLTMSIGDHTLRGCAVRKPGEKAARIYAWYQTDRLLFRLELSGVVREKAYELLQTLRTDPERERAAAASRPDRFEDDLISFNRPGDWELVRPKPHYYQLERGRHRLTIYVGSHAGSMDYKNFARNRILKDGQTIEVGMLEGNSSLGSTETPPTFVQRFEAIDKEGATLIVDLTTPQGFIRAADLATYWRVLASLDIRWKPEPTTAPAPSVALQEIERRLGIELEKLVSFRRIRGRTYLGIGTYQVVRVAGQGGMSVPLSRCTLRDPKNRVMRSFETMYLEQKGKLSLIGHKRLVGGTHRFYSVATGGHWVVRVADGEPKKFGKLGILDGVYEPENLPELAMWLVGRKVSAGARSKLRLFHGPRAEVVTASLEFNRAPKANKVGIALYCRYILSSGEKGAMGLDKDGKVLTILDGGVLLMPGR